jgi:hypothetical protein
VRGQSKEFGFPAAAEVLNEAADAGAAAGQQTDFQSLRKFRD